MRELPEKLQKTLVDEIVVVAFELAVSEEYLEILPNQIVTILNCVQTHLDPLYEDVG